MKTQTSLLIALITVVIVSCGTQKKMVDNKLNDTIWELEYISGPRIAFDGLYPDKKPTISFDKETGKVSGNNSCNGYSATYTLDGDTISLGAPGPTTMMYCGDGEQQFLRMMEKINTYSFDEEGKLNLMIDDIPVMRFKKSEN